MTILATFDFNRTTLRAEATLDVLRPVFEDRIFSRRADVIWLTRSWDLLPLDYYLWGAVKDKWYANKPETIDALKDNIREAIGEIQMHIIDNVLKNSAVFLKHFPKKNVFGGPCSLNNIDRHID